MLPGLDVEDPYGLKQLKKSYHQAELIQNGRYEYYIKIPKFNLKSNYWNKSEITLYFNVPYGFPYVCPDCFWVDGDLRLEHGGFPQQTDFRQPVWNWTRDTEELLWFSHHLNHWNPHKDTLYTYVKSCLYRLSLGR